MGGVLVRFVKTDPQGEAQFTVRQYNPDVDFPDITGTTPTERQFMEANALGGVLVEAERFRIEIYNPTNNTRRFNPSTTKLSIPYRLANLTTRTASDRVLTPYDLDRSRAAMDAGTTISCWPRTWTSIGEFVVTAKTQFALGNSSSGNLDKNNSRLLIIPWETV